MASMYTNPYGVWLVAHTLADHKRIKETLGDDAVFAGLMPCAVPPDKWEAASAAAE